MSESATFDPVTGTCTPDTPAADSGKLQDIPYCDPVTGSCTPGAGPESAQQPAATDDRVPIDRHFGVSTENVGVEYLLADAVLAGIDHFGLRHGGGDSADVFLFDGVTEYDSRWHSFWGWSTESALRCRRRGKAPFSDLRICKTIKSQSPSR